MRRCAIAFLGSSASLCVGCLLGFWIAHWYEIVNYAPEPDPLHFDVAGVWLLTWTAIWVLGTVASLWLAFSRTALKQLAKPE